MDDVRAIEQLKARYCRLMDTKDWAGMRLLFTDEVEMDTAEAGGGSVAGADAFMEFLQGVIGEVTTVHHVHAPEIELTSPTEATGVWAMEDMLRWPGGTEMHGYGHYHETYRKDVGAWRISSSRWSRLAPTSPSPHGLRPSSRRPRTAPGR